MADTVHSDDLLSERGFSLIGGGETSGGSYFLAAIDGFDWKGEGYDKTRSQELKPAHDFAVQLVKAGKRGVYTVMGSDEAPVYSWPVWAVINVR
jgi:hypothetical protein